MESDYASVLVGRRAIRRDFGLWCEHALAPQGFVPAAHHRLLIRELQAVADGVHDRLAVFMPPGSAKSTYTIRDRKSGSLQEFPDSDALLAAGWGVD